MLLLPGLGTDARLFDAQRAAGLDIAVPDWIEPYRGEPLAHYGRRMAQTIESSEPFVLGGVSFGSMVALEMAKHLQPHAVVVIAGAWSCDALPRWMRALTSAGRLLPAAAAKPVIAAAIGLMLRHERIDREQYKLLRAMYDAADARFFKWAACEAARWRLEGRLSMPVRMIHGSDDRLLRSDRPHADVVVEGGGHMINVTHASQVNDALRGL